MGKRKSWHKHENVKKKVVTVAKKRSFFWKQSRVLHTNFMTGSINFINLIQYVTTCH